MKFGTKIFICFVNKNGGEGNKLDDEINMKSQKYGIMERRKIGNMKLNKPEKVVWAQNKSLLLTYYLKTFFPATGVQIQGLIHAKLA